MDSLTSYFALRLECRIFQNTQNHLIGSSLCAQLDLTYTADHFSRCLYQHIQIYLISHDPNDLLIKKVIMPIYRGIIRNIVTPTHVLLLSMFSMRFGGAEEKIEFQK